ncbi:hypothetical protein HMI55_006262 [Coelomomyces lativittatus]|nr:hypothetical protein HMI55_006262 [Coelomomyces lativittatus]
MEDILSFFKDTISIFLPSWQVQIYFLPLIPLFFAFFAAIYRISYLMNFPRVHSILEEPSPLLYFIRLLFTGSAFLIPLIQVWIHPWFDTEMEDIVLNSIWTAFSCISLTIVLVWMHIEHKKSRHLSWILMGFWFLNLMISISNVLVHLNLDTGFWPCVLPTCLLFLNLGCLCLSMLSAHKEEHELPTISFWTWLKYTLRFHPKCQKFPRWLLPTSLVEGEIGHHQALFQLFFRSSLPWLCLHVLFGLSLMYFIQTSLKVAGVLMCFLGWTYSIAKLHLGLGELKALTMLTKSVYLHTLQSIVPPTFEVWIQTPQKILNEVHWLRQSKIQCVLVFFSVVLLCTFIFESVFFDVVTPMLVSWMVTYWISLFRPVFEEHHFGLQWKTHRSILTWLQSIATFRCSLSMPVWLSHLKKEYKKERVCECYRQFSFFLPNLTDHACFFYSTYCVFQTGSPIMYFQLVCLASFYALKQSMTFKPTTYEQPSQVHPVSPRASFAKLPTMSMLKKPAIYIEGYLHCFFNELTVLLGEKNVELVQSILKQKVAYVPKVHWFIEGSIRDNILFGKGWDSDWFAEVIKCTELSDELTKFGHASIGINGSRLNERQMLQISFARAIYSRENVIFIEDPPIKELNLISVFSNCFGQGGITSSQCRIWLTGKPCIPCDWVFPLNKQVKKSNLQCEGGVMEIEHLHCSTELYPYGPSTWTSFSNFIKHAGLVIVPCLLLSVLLQGVFISLFIYIINDGFHFIFASVIYLLFYGCILILIGAGSWSISYNFFKLLIKTVSCFKLPMFEQHVNGLFKIFFYFFIQYRI